MIEYINKRLIDWATWRRRTDDGGTGYATSARFCEMACTQGVSCAGPIVEGAAAMEIDRIIAALKTDRKKQYEVAYWVYLAGSLTMDRVASELHCCRDTVYTRLHALHLHVMDELHEITIQASERRKNISMKLA